MQRFCVCVFFLFTLQKISLLAVVPVTRVAQGNCAGNLTLVGVCVHVCEQN